MGVSGGHVVRMLAIAYLTKYDSVLLDLLDIGILLWLFLTPGNPRTTSTGVPGVEDHEILP